MGLHEEMLCFNCELTLIFLFRICCKVSHHITIDIYTFLQVCYRNNPKKNNKIKISLYNLTLKTKNNKMFRHSSLNKIHTFLLPSIKFK